MYRTAEIAKKVKVHPNTVRIYEEWRYISPVPRKTNGYRMYTELHLFQLRIARLTFHHEIVQGLLREKAKKIVQASGQEDFRQAEELAHLYGEHLKQEHQHALQAIQVVQNWLHGQETPTHDSYSRKEVAKLLHLTPEVLRNWERNGLITIPRLANGHRYYTQKEIERLSVIRSLRAAHFSITSILRLVQYSTHHAHFDIKQVLNTPASTEDIVSVTDRLEASLAGAIEHAQQLVIMLHHYNATKDIPHL